MIGLGIGTISLNGLIPHSLCSAEELDLELCFASGQTFTWSKHKEYWYNVLDGKVLILSQKDNEIVYWVMKEEGEEERIQSQQQKAIGEYLKKYFRLADNLKLMYKEWATRDAYFNEAATQYRAIRLLNQPAFESLLSFICSQNNAISRITTMVNKLKHLFGKSIAVFDENVMLKSFPDPMDLTEETVVDMLRQNGFGYRAPYINDVARKIVDGELDLMALKDTSYQNAWEQLLKVKGIGPKVADCVALTGLGHMDAVPIDTHLWHIAKVHYKGMPKASSLTLKTYIAIGERFRKIFGPQAGWAHLILFAAQIRKKNKGK